MRNLSSNYSVSYVLLTRDNVEKVRAIRTACYSSAYRTEIKEDDILVLTDFITEETKDYASIYIKRISKICGVKIISLQENELRLTNIKSKFILKLFTTLFRLLFETFPVYQKEEKSNEEKTLLFFKSYIKEKNNSGYKDMLERLIYNYQINEIHQGPGHGITTCPKQKIAVKNISNVQNWIDKSGNMQDFFVK